ncbi:PAS domain S-box-containing protein/diguanylate cyclase (GGDEF) domain-containing protein [Lentzea xinjiangensis]|uniref:PAS domain S-box-containing protein/diguanylate cyclase (GGDEF) domain-containing protein n=1 Tax=Lentzea xinjiangensis TaxID=402600 RepID=A0A1H9GL64_9PSEU|nr:diguanylate cyclase [Lentzea xinjiangensis]SEQ50862.1 PAS domain S-box-containing protein/diguanylate cyclase (GGDEF) domain-containing protein [Lentzea xinjiangensis]
MTDRHHDATRELVRRAHEADPAPVRLDTAAGLAALLDRAGNAGEAAAGFDRARDAGGTRQALARTWAYRLSGVPGAVPPESELGAGSRARSTAEAWFDEVVMSSRSGVLLVGPDGRLLRANEAVGDVLGRGPDELAGLSLLELAAPDSMEPLRAVLSQVRDGTSGRFRQRLRMAGAGGEAVPVSLAVSLLRGAADEPGHHIVVIEGDTEPEPPPDAFGGQPRYDPLTGLPDRTAFSARLGAVLRGADRRHGITLFHLGLDGFDLVCDALGRHAGDALLRHAAQRLESIMARESAVVARLGDGEFGVVVENSSQTPGIAAVMDEIGAHLAEPVYVDGNGLAVSVSAGVVHLPPHDIDPAELLSAAGSALRRARSAGRGQWRLFHPGQAADDRLDQALAVVMPGAWESGQIGVRYRPVRSLRLDVLVAVEAELCWEHPGLPEPLPHGRCAALAERTGLVLALGEWLLRLACGEVRRWWGRQPGGPLAVRLTAHQATDATLVRRVERALDETGFEAHRLMLSMPAGALSESDAVDNLTTLAGVGVYTMLDDFGLGPWEVAAVQDLPVACVRLRRGLLPGRAPHVTTLLSLLHQEGVAIAVDGIDSAEIAGWWRDAGADFGAGDFVGTAIAPARLGELLELR